MDVDGLPIIGPGVDYTQVGSIHQKRTLAFINHFISNTVSFLNKFARSCELRLEKFESQLQKLEASLSILEAKLSSISGLENVELEQQADAKVETATKDQDTIMPEVKSENEKQPETDVPQADVKEDTISISQNPQYAKFFRLIQYGANPEAVKQKMKAEGLDPSVLEKPNMKVPKPPTLNVPAQDNSDNSFSD